MTVVRSRCSGVQMHGDHMFWGTKIMGLEGSEVCGAWPYSCRRFGDLPSSICRRLSESHRFRSVACRLGRRAEFFPQKEMLTEDIE